MIARPKISRNEWKPAERGAFEVGNFALLSCPGIYRRNYVDEAAAADGDDAGDVSVATGLLALVAVVLALAYPTYYLLSFGSRLGPRRSRAWISALAFASVFVWAVVEPLVIVFWQVFLPSLLKDHMQHLADPSALRTFPFETDLPDGPTHHLVALEETLNHGPIVRFLHGDDHHAVTGARKDVDRVIDDVAEIHRHRHYDGVLGPETLALTALFGGFVALPPPLQDMLVEWALELLPLPGVWLLAALRYAHRALAALEPDGRDHDAALVLVALWCLLVAAVVLWRAARTLAAGPRAAAAALRARDARRRDDDRRRAAGDDAALCAICLDAPREVVFNCDHYVLCGACAATVAECPVCRAPITERRRVFAT